MSGSSPDQTGRSEGPTARGRLSGFVSDEPLINTIHKWGPELLFAAYVAGMIYMCFVPFDFRRTPSDFDAVIYGLRIQSFNMPDILANLGAYVPLGAFAFFVARRTGRGRAASGMIVLLGVGFLSYAVEFGQQFAESRVSSWIDTTSNLLGAMVGMILVGTWEGTVGRAYLALRRSVDRRPWSALSKIAVCAVLMIQLRPYDVVVDPIHTAFALRHADVGPLAVWQGLEADVSRDIGTGRRSGMQELRRVQWEYCLDRVGDVAAYAAVAAILSIAIIVGSGGDRRRAFRRAGFVSVSLACMVMVLRVFLISHGLDSTQILCGAVGWPIGCLVAHRVCGKRTEVGCDRPSWKLGRWPLVAGLGVASLVLAYELAPFDFGTLDLSVSHVIWLPFEGHFHAKPNDAVYDISGKLLRYACLGACLMLLISRTRWQLRRQLRLMVCTVMFVAVLVQVFHLSSPTRHTDITTVILAGIGSLFGAVGTRWLIDYHTYLSMASADDLLTTRLIDGPSYDRKEAIGPHLSHTGVSPKDRVESGQQR